MALAAARTIIRAATARRSHALIGRSSSSLAHAAAARFSSVHLSLLSPLGSFGPSRLFASSTASSSDASIGSSSTPSVARQLQSRLSACLSAQDAPRAERLIRAFEAQGGRCDAAMLNAWIGCFGAAGDWRGAERVWQRISELQLRPDAVSYRNLIKIYTQRGSIEQLAKIGPLLAEMHQAGLEFSVSDFQQLIKTAHASAKPNVVRTWVQLAEQAGLLQQLDEPTTRIAANPVNRPVEVAAAAPQPANPPRAAVTAADLAAVKADLAACLANSDSARATQLLLAFEQLGGQCTAELFNMALACHRATGDWQGAERMWARMPELKVRPSNVSCRILLQIYTRAGHAQQLAKIDPVLTAMKQDGVRFRAHDYVQLIKSAQACMLPQEALRWTERARSEGKMAQLDELAASAVVAAQPAAAALNASRPFAKKPALMSLLQSDKFSASPPPSASPPVEAASPLAATPSAAAEDSQSSVTLSKSLAASFADSDRSALIALDRAIYRNSILEQMQSGGSAEQTAQIDYLILEMHAAHLSFAAQDFSILIKHAHLRALPGEVRRWSDRAREAGVFEQMDRLGKRVAARAATPGESSSPVAAIAAAAASAPSPPLPSPVAAAPAPSAPTISLDPTVIWRQLQNCVVSGGSARAEQIVREVHARGATCDVAMMHTWIGSCLKQGDWQGAERAWAFMLDRNLQPTHVSYCKLFQVYLHARTKDQLAKMGSLLIAMQHAGIAFSARDFEQLIKCAHACKLPAQVRRWTEVARSAGLFEELDELSRALATWPCNRDSNASAVQLPLPVAVAPSGKQSAALLALQSQLTACVSSGNSSHAEDLLRGFEQQGGHCDLALLNLWLSCFRARGDWQGAERAWKRIAGLRLKPDRRSYSLLIQIYLSDGSQTQRAKIDPLLVAMRQKHVVFAITDYQRLIQCAHAASLTLEVRKLSDHARAAGLFNKMDDASRTIAESVAPHHPAVSSQTNNKAASVKSLLHGHNSEALPLSAAPIVAAEPAAPAPTQAAASAESTVAVAAPESEPAAPAVEPSVPLAPVDSPSAVRTVSALSAWLKCYANAGDWKGAEQAWQQAAEINLALTNVHFRNLILVYLQAGDEQIAKIDPLLAQMQSAGLSFAAKDFEKLILSCLRCQRPDELRRWSGAARAAGLFDKLPAHVRENAEKVLAPTPLASTSRAQEAAVAAEAIPASTEVREPTESSATPAAAAAIQPPTNSEAQQQQKHGNSTVSASAEPSIVAPVPRPQTSPRVVRAPKPAPSQMELELARAIVRSLAALEQHPFRMEHAQNSAMLQSQ